MNNAIKIVFLLACFLVHYGLMAQPTLSMVQLKTMHGKMVTYGAVTQKDSLVLICFWASTSEASINAMNAVNANYEKWKDAVKFRLMIVDVDEGKAQNKVRPMINMNGWTFDVYSDINGDLRKVLNSNNLPQAMIIQRGKVVYQQSGYEPGSENYLLNKLQAIEAGRQ
jgi:cytochrome c biogenesis protein CcmG/thiol:disulfide interchange protein DsbE